MLADHLVLPGHDALDLGEGGGGQQHRHEQQRALLQGGHELAAEALGVAGKGIRQQGLDGARQAQGDDQAQGQQGGGQAQHRLAVTEGPVEDRVVEAQQGLHQPVVFLGLEGAAHQQGTEHRHRRHRQQGGADQSEGLGIGQGMEELAFLAGEQEDRHEGEDDDQHGEHQGPSDLGGGGQGLVPDLGGGQPACQAGRGAFAVADDVLGHDDARIHQDADGDGDAGEGHDVRRDAELVHQDEGDEDGGRQRQGDDEDAAEVEQEQDVHQDDEEDLLG